MPDQRAREAVEAMNRLFGEGTLTALTDSQLLGRFAADRDELAFKALVARHAAMVLSVCRGVLTDPNDADDAFQATLFVLARKARSIRSGETLGGWLCRVAYRIAVRAGVEAARRRRSERQVAGGIAAANIGFAPEPAGSDAIAVLFEELDKLPDRYRIPVVLCHLEGLTTQAAAERLGCPVGTIWGRLSRARARLRQRLLSRGLTLTAAALAGDVLLKPAQAAISGSLVATTVRSAMKFAALNEMALGVSSAHVAKLTRGALRAMVKSQLKTAAMVVLGFGVMAGIGTGVLARVHQPIAAKTGTAQGKARSTIFDAPQPAGRVLRFPATRALGIIYVQDADKLDLAPIRSPDPWRRVGEARGLVRLPARGLVRLDLSKASLDDLSPLDRLAPDAIHSLRLDHLGARDEALLHIGHMKALKEIALDGNFITDAGLAPLAGLRRLESISLNDSLIGDAGIRHIAGLPDVRCLGLYRSKITDTSLGLIGNMMTLVSLDLGVTAITDRGIGHIKDLKNLGWLRFSQTNTTDASLAVAAGLVSLQSLDFDDIRATDAGLAHLVSLKKLKWLRAVDNPFTDAGLAHIAKFPCIEHVRLGNRTRFTDAGLASLSEAHSLKLLNLSGKFTDAGLAHLAKLPALESLWLWNSKGAITGKGIYALRETKTLKRLELSNSALGGLGLQVLCGFPSLEALLLQDESLTFDDLARLGKCTQLKDFRLWRMALNPGRPTLRPFRELKALTWLELPHKASGSDDGIDFAPAEFAHLSGLTKLETLEYSGRITDEGLKHLAPLTAMSYLALRNADVTDEGLKYLSGMKNLDFLVIGGRITDQGLAHLQALTSLRFLSLETKTVSLEAIKELRAKLPALHTVQPFDGLDPLIRGPQITYTRVGEIAPDFTVTTRDGSPFHLAGQQGKVVLAHFWGPKCAPCLRAMPKLAELHKELSARPGRFAMIGLTTGMEEKEWRAFLDQNGMRWPEALLTGENQKVWDQFHVRGIPDYVVIGRDGKIIADGESTDRDIEKLKATIIFALGP